MKLKLRKISYYNSKRIDISIEARYGWGSEMHGEIIHIIFNVETGVQHVNVKAEHPGIGTVAQRIIDVVSKYPPIADGTAAPAGIIIENLSEHLDFEYDYGMLQDFISGKGEKSAT